MDALAASPSPEPTPIVEMTASNPPAGIATETRTPTPADPWQGYPAPTAASVTEIPPPIDPIAFGPQVVNILLLGSDQRVGSYGYRTDSIMIVSLNPQARTAHLLSVPRDLYVYIPGWRVDRINTADARGGSDILADTIRYNFGIELDHWVRVNFSSFVAMIDGVGGIEVESTGYLKDECGGKVWSYEPGRYEMDGFEALCYVRMRYTSSDFDRLRRQQEVARALFDKALTLDVLTKLPELYDRFGSSVQTDMSYADMVPLAATVLSIVADPDRIYTLTFDRSVVNSWRVPSSGAYVLLPDYAAIEALLQAAFNPDAAGEE